MRRYRPGKSRRIGGRAPYHSCRSKDPSLRINQDVTGERGNKASRFGDSEIDARGSVTGYKIDATTIFQVKKSINGD